MWRAALERRLNAIWYEGARPWPGLKLLAQLYAWLRERRRRRAVANPPAPLPVPVVVVGNLTAGGSGKTPLVLALARYLSAAGWRPGIVSRGYGRRERPLRRVATDSLPEQVGDEPLLLRRRSGLPVVVANDRRAAAQVLLDEDEVDLILADDGLEHWGLPRSLEIVVIDARRGFGNGLLLPAGPLRAPPERATEAALRVANGGEWPAATTMRLQATSLRRLDGGDELPVSWLAGQAVNAAAGIAHPQRFFATLAALGAQLRLTLALPDHAAAAELTAALSPAAEPWIVTEKDAMKLDRPPIGCVVLVLAVEARLEEGFWAALEARLGTPTPQVHHDD